MLQADPWRALEEMQAEMTALARERQRYAELFCEAPEARLVTDRHGTIVEANRAAGLLLGHPPERLAGKPLAALIALPARRAFRASRERGTTRLASGRSTAYRSRPMLGAGGETTGHCWLFEEEA